MNSALQCLARIPNLTDYFSVGNYKKGYIYLFLFLFFGLLMKKFPEINRTNPLGMEGKIAEGFAAVLIEVIFHWRISNC
jgi:hypothetical protein